MDEAIQLAIAICPLVLVDVIDTDTVRFDFQAAGGAREFADELITRDGRFRIARLDTEVIVRTV